MRNWRRTISGLWRGSNPYWDKIWLIICKERHRSHPYFSSRICTAGAIFEILLFQPEPFFPVFRNIDSLDFEDDRARSVTVASNHQALIVDPLAHGRPVLESDVNILADNLSRLAAEAAIHQMVESSCSVVHFKRKVSTF